MTINESETAENTALATDNGEWTLQIGCHQGTMTSRDSTVVNSKVHGKEPVPLKSLDDCIECAKHYAQYWKVTGYYVWYAHAISPTGDRFAKIVPSVPYS